MGLEKFSAALDLLKGFQVTLYVGEDIFKGKLIGVETDHVVLETENKYIFYYNIDKIQAILKNTKQFQPEQASVEFKKTQSLMELLHSFQYSWVTILSINKQSFYGVLSEIDEDFVTLINGEERILIKVAQISNILKGFIKEKQEKKEQEKTESKNETNNQEKESNESNESDSKKKTETDNSKESNESKGSKEKTKTNKSNEKVEDHFSYPAIKEYKAETKASEKKSKSPSTYEKFEIKIEAESSEVMEPNQMVVWSSSHKSEPTIQDYLSAKGNMYLDEFESMQMFKNEVKKPVSDIVQKEHKKGEAIGSKSNNVKSHQEPEKPSKPTSTSPSAKKEKKQEKPQETVTPVSEKTETSSQEKVYNDTKKVWRQKKQESRAVRVTSEPVSQTQERTFPFAGWPSNNNRTFRF
jgi:hypothetical protein